MPGINKRFNQEFATDQERDPWTDRRPDNLVLSYLTGPSIPGQEEAPYYSLPMQGTGLMKDIAIAIKQKAKAGFDL